MLGCSMHVLESFQNLWPKHSGKSGIVLIYINFSRKMKMGLRILFLFFRNFVLPVFVEESVL